MKITRNSATTPPTYQPKLDTVRDPLDGEAGDEDEDGQEH